MFASIVSADVYAEGSPTKKPIYDAPPPIVLPPSSSPTHPTPTQRLAIHIGTARKFINSHYRIVCNKLDSSFTKYLHYEHSITSTIANLAPPKDSPEKVLPGAIYVVIATMAGGIVSRNRFWPVRVVTPVVVGVGAAWYFVPQTTKNVNELMWEWEKKVPRVAETHLLIREGIEDGLRRTVEMTVETKTILDDAVGKARKAAEDLVRKG